MEFIETNKGWRNLSKDVLRGAVEMDAMLDATAKFVTQVHQHNHAADLEGNDLLKASAGIKWSAKDTAEKRKKLPQLTKKMHGHECQT